MSELYYLNVTIHVVAALVWLGGMFFLAAVGAPILRGVDPALRSELFRRLGERFRAVGWIAITVLVITGFLNLHYRGLLAAELWTSGAFWGSGVGQALAWKLVTVTLMIVISAIHDFSNGPRASRATPGSEEALRLRRSASLLARANAIIGLVLVFAAVRLARGG